MPRSFFGLPLALRRSGGRRPLRRPLAVLRCALARRRSALSSVGAALSQKGGVLRISAPMAHLTASGGLAPRSAFRKTKPFANSPQNIAASLAADLKIRLRRRALPVGTSLFFVGCFANR